MKDIPCVLWLHVVPSQQKNYFEFIFLLQVIFTIKLFFHELFLIALAIVPSLAPPIFVVALIQPSLMRHNASSSHNEQFIKTYLFPFDANYPKDLTILEFEKVV